MPRKSAVSTRQRRSSRRPGKLRSHASAAANPHPSPGVGSGLAPGMQSINTYLAVANVTASMTFLERAFGFTRGVVLPDADGQPRYAEMRHRESVVMLIRKGDTATPSGGLPALYTYVDDIDRQLTAARDAGGGVSEPEDKSWGDRVAVVTDPDGYRWTLATFKKLVPFT
jgi:PhnB protein